MCPICSAAGRGNDGDTSLWTSPSVSNQSVYFTNMSLTLTILFTSFWTSETTGNCPPLCTFVRCYLLLRSCCCSWCTDIWASTVLFLFLKASERGLIHLNPYYSTIYFGCWRFDLRTGRWGLILLPIERAKVLAAWTPVLTLEVTRAPIVWATVALLASTSTAAAASASSW